MRGTKARFLRFLMAGGTAAAVNLASRYVLDMAMPYEWAVILAYLCGMTTAWILSRLFVFEASGLSPGAEFARFGLVNLVAAAQVWGISVGLAEYVFPAVGFFWYHYDIAHLIGVIVPVFTSYFGHKYFSFRSATGGTAEGAASPPVEGAAR